MWSCTATKDGDDWVIDGTKIFVSNIGVADYYVVKTVTGEYDATTGAGQTHFMVEKGTPGFRVEKIEDKLGWRGSNTGVLRFDGVRVPALNKLGGFNLATAECPHIYYCEFVACGGVALGMCETAYEMAFQYALKRPTKSGTPYYFVYESMRTRLAAMRADVDALRGYIYDRTSRIDEGEISMGHSLLVKAYAWRVAERVCSQAMDLHGAVGVVKGSGVERLLRDAKVGQIGGGQYEHAPRCRGPSARGGSHAELTPRCRQESLPLFRAHHGCASRAAAFSARARSRGSRRVLDAARRRSAALAACRSARRAAAWLRWRYRRRRPR